MEGSERDDLRRQLREREVEVSDLRRQLEQTQEENDRLRHENEELRKELKAAGRGSRHGKRKPKADPKGPGRKAGQGRFTFRRAPTSSEPPIEVPVTVGHCPCCGGELRYERTDEATVTDMPQAAQPSHGVSDSSPASQRRGPELIPTDYAGVMVTDRGKSYDAEELLGVKQQKCLDHLKENLNEVLEHKAGRARSSQKTRLLHH